MISQPTTDTSVAANAVASAADTELITKETPVDLVPGVRFPVAAAPVAPIDSLHTRTRELAVSAVVLIVMVPPIKVAVPIELAPAAAPEPTLVRIILFPAAVRTKFPFVAVMLPRVAVRDVDVVNEPVTAVFPVAFPMLTAPVPPVPIVVTAEPEALMLAVPTVVRVVAETAAGVPDPKAGGAAKLTLKVIVPAVPAVESIPVPAARVMFPATGVIAPPLDPVRLVISPAVLEPREIHTPDAPEYI